MTGTRRTFADVEREILDRYPNGETSGGLSFDDILELRIKRPFESRVDIARAMATVMRADMAAFDLDSSRYTRSLGCCSGFHAQQMIAAVQRHFGTANGAYVYLSGWMVAGMRSRFGPLPDQSMHEKTAVVDLANEIYTFLTQTDEVRLHQLFDELRAARATGADNAQLQEIIAKIDNLESAVVPMIADIDAGHGDSYATYVLAKAMIEAGACCLQIENQTSDLKKCGHMAGKVTVPPDEFHAKLRACRAAFETLDVDGIIIARTDSLDAGLTEKIPVSRRPGDLADRYISWIDTDETTTSTVMREGDLALFRNERLMRPKRLANGLFEFQPGTGRQRVIDDCIAALQEGGADLVWIETSTPDVDEMASMVTEIRKTVPHAKVVYNNSPSFNWMFNLRNQVRNEWLANNKISADDYPGGMGLMSPDIDGTELDLEANERLRRFHSEMSRRAGVFHHLITLPTWHDTALSVDKLAEGYFGPEGMAAYVKRIQLEEIRRGLPAVTHQQMVGSDVGDGFREVVSGDQALKAGGDGSTMKQFGAVA